MSQTGQIIIGDGLKLYYDTAGAASGTFENQVPTVDNVTMPDTRQTGTLNERGKAFILSTVGKREVKINFTMPHRPGNTHYNAIRTAYTGNTPVGLLVLSGPADVAGHHGIKADCKITKFEPDYPNDGSPASVSCEAVFDAESATDPANVTTS